MRILAEHFLLYRKREVSYKAKKSAPNTLVQDERIVRGTTRITVLQSLYGHNNLSVCRTAAAHLLMNVSRSDCG